MIPARNSRKVGKKQGRKGSLVCYQAGYHLDNWELHELYKIFLRIAHLRGEGAGVLIHRVPVS